MCRGAAMAKDIRRELVDFLVQRAFDPVLKARVDGSGAEQAKLGCVQDATRAEIDRFRAYGSAEEVVVNFKRDLSSAPASTRSIDFMTAIVSHSPAQRWPLWKSPPPCGTIVNALPDQPRKRSGRNASGSSHRRPSWSVP